MRISGGQFADQMTLPLRQAMAAVVWLEGRVPNVHKPHEASEAKAALTDADCVSQEILLTALREYFPEVALEAEEDTPAVKAFAANDSPHTVHVDPIDGTLRYLRRDGPYAIIVGLEYEGRVEASLVAVPQENVLIRAVLGGGAEISLGGGPFAPALLQGSGTRVLVSHAVPERIGTNVGRYAELDDLVLSGIVWEEARPQLASKAFLIHQPVGRGQIVAFAEDPNYRAYTEATQLLFMNAVLLGPGR